MVDLNITLQKTQLTFFDVQEVVNSLPHFELLILDYSLEGEQGRFHIHTDIDLPELAVSYPLMEQFYKADFEAILYPAQNFEEKVTLNKNLIHLAMGGYRQFTEKNRILDLAVKVLLGSKIDVPNNLADDWDVLRNALYSHADKQFFEGLEKDQSSEE